MKKLVTIYEVYETQLIIEADSDGEAKDKAELFLERGYTDNPGEEIPDGCYSYRLDADEWRVQDYP